MPHRQRRLVPARHCWRWHRLLPGADRQQIVSEWAITSSQAARQHHSMYRNAYTQPRRRACSICARLPRCASLAEETRVLLRLGVGRLARAIALPRPAQHIHLLCPGTAHWPATSGRPCGDLESSAQLHMHDACASARQGLVSVVSCDRGDACNTQADVRSTSDDSTP